MKSLASGLRASTDKWQLRRQQMSRAKDFSSDLESISSMVEKDVGAFMKLVREEHAPKPSTSEQPSVPQSESSAPMRGSDAPEQNAPTLANERKFRRNARTKSKLAAEEQVILENVTTRLRRETNELLTEAALRQRLKNETPATRQDIVEEALQDWFRKHSYRRSDETSP
jgi:hypothetical protein